MASVTDDEMTASMNGFSPTAAEAQRVRDDIAAAAVTAAAGLRARRAELEHALHNVPRGTRDAALRVLDLAIQDVEANLPFLSRQMETAADRVVTEAKAVIEAAATHAMLVQGPKALAALPDQDVRQISDPTKE